MKTGLIERLNAGEILVCDGAMGTMIQERGYVPGGSPEKWGVDNAKILATIHRDYIRAGADIILTNTFGGNRAKLSKYGLGDQVAELNHRLVEIAAMESSRSSRTVLIAGDVGPTGEFMQPLGLLTEQDMIAIFSEQIAALVDGGVDLVFIETMMDIGEAVAAVKAAKSVADIPLFASMTYNIDRNGFRTMMGVSPAQAAKALMEAGADVIGANCGDVLASKMPELVREYKQAGARFVVVEPNAGVPEMVDGKTVFSQSAEEMAKHVPEILAAGANVIGGCCGTTPEHIKLIAESVERLR